MMSHSVLLLRCESDLVASELYYCSWDLEFSICASKALPHEFDGCAGLFAQSKESHAGRRSAWLSKFLFLLDSLIVRTGLAGSRVQIVQRTRWIPLRAV